MTAAVDAGVVVAQTPAAAPAASGAASSASPAASAPSPAASAPVSSLVPAPAPGPVSAPAPSPVPVPAPSTTTAPLATTRTSLNGQTLGTVRWADGDTTTGGQGSPIAGVSCASTVNYHIHTHLSIFYNGIQYAMPSHIGIVGSCDYGMHTHDSSGVMHVETAAPATYTLAQFFALWGMPLSATQVADLTDPTMVVYINDTQGTAGLQIHTGDVTQIQMGVHREITIQLGTPPAAIPTYDWSLVDNG